MNGYLASWQILALFTFALLKTRWLAQENQRKCVLQIKTKQTISALACATLWHHQIQGQNVTLLHVVGFPVD